MRPPALRFALTGGAVLVLVIAGMGVAAAAGAPSTTATLPAAAADADQGDTAPLDADLALELAANETSDERAARDGSKLRRLLRLGRHLVHAEVTVTDKDGNLVHLQLDHGTVQSIGGGTLVIAEAGGGTESVATNDATIVWLAREKVRLDAVKVGAEIFVQSRIDGGTVLAKRILVIPAGT
jgi:hypothetical protein